MQDIHELDTILNPVGHIQEVPLRTNPLEVGQLQAVESELGKKLRPQVWQVVVVAHDVQPLILHVKVQTLFVDS
ncbi:MAG: hypothetical protein E6Q89_08390 [Bacteroidia bacterium]|nr:MAG: hypothetical protein E6Q89_08390 [Bacteroidia bacterium]